MDFIGAWIVHWIQHNIRWLWKFHIIHHSDPNVYVTSGLRHHPVENVFRLLFTILAILKANEGIVLPMRGGTNSNVFYISSTASNGTTAGGNTLGAKFLAVT